MSETLPTEERRDFGVSDCAHLLEQVASSLLEKHDGPRQQTIASQRDRLRRQLDSIRDNAEIIARVAGRLRERYEEL